MEQVGIVFVTGNQSAEVLQPAYRPFDFPPFSVAAKAPTILGGWLASISPMGRDQFDAPPCKSLSKRITVCCRVIDQSSWTTPKNATFQEWLDECYLMWTGAGNGGRERQTARVGEDHRFRPLASLGLANQIAPFFAEENVPSAIASSRSIWPCRSSARRSLAQALVQMPAAVHSWKRRQQVGYEGKCWGRSFQRAPLRSTHKMPSTQRRGSIAGRPRLPVRGSCGNRSAINRHCSSASSDLGSILDPAGSSARDSRDRVDISGLLSDHCYEINSSNV